MLCVALTGGIGSGKSTAANVFRKLNVPVIDADIIARQVVLPGTDALKKIAEHYGKNILQLNGHLDRRELRKRIFSKPASRKWLESLLHPLILDEMKLALDCITSPYCIFVIPLITRDKQYNFIDRILVIDTPEEIQVERTKYRDKNSSKEEIEAIIKSQISRSDRLKLADDVITNNGTMTALKDKIKALHQQYLKLSQDTADT